MNHMAQEQSQQKSLNVHADNEMLAGRYANAFSVTSQERDVVLDFISHVSINGNNQAELVSRIFLNHFTAQQLIDTLKKTLGQWEKLRYEGQKPQV